MKRREFIRATALGSVALSAGAVVDSIAAPNSQGPVPIIDTHTHFYDPFRPQCVPWPGKNEAAP